MPSGNILSDFSSKIINLEPVLVLLHCKEVGLEVVYITFVGAAAARRRPAFYICEKTSKKTQISATVTTGLFSIFVVAS